MPNLIGTGNNQVPTNGMLGGLAYQSPDNVVIKNLELTNLSGHNSLIPSTAVDVFVYDTRKDSDGGAWRKRTQHTSWYNETLNTTTRGSRKDFPAVAVIIATSTSVTIYDGDDPDMPMWMIFNTTDGSMLRSGQITSISMLNAELWVGHGSGSGLHWINFLKDTARWLTGSSSYGGFFIKRDISRRNESGENYYNNIGGASDITIAESSINDVAMTVLPNAPIDSATGLPVPTIAVSTIGGISVIRDNGTVENTDVANNVKLGFVKGDRLAYGHRGGYEYAGRAINVSPFRNSLQYGYYINNSVPSFGNLIGSAGTILGVGDGNIYGYSTEGIRRIFEDETNKANGMANYITTSYNTGWMHGDIKGAWLSDTSTASVTGTELVTNGDFATGTLSGWSTSGTTTPSISSGGALLTTGIVDGSIWQAISITGKVVITWTITSNSGGFFGLFLSTSSSNGSGGSLVLDGITASGSYYYDGTITAIEFRHRGSSSGIIDNISVRRVEEDRSVNNKGLAVYGTITKTPVATGANLVAYSGFSTNNYLQQPYNSSIVIGASDSLCIMAWSKHGATGSYALIYCVGEPTSGRSRYLYTFAGVPLLDTHGGAGNQGTRSIADDQWHHVVGIYRPSGGQIYVDGQLFSSPTWTQGYLSPAGTSYYSRIGIDLVSSANTTHPGSIALVRVSNSVPSPEQILKIYNDEKVLFQPNSQCTLYGSSDAVTALAYDETTKLLHVGTSSGRSDFQGLERVANTTTAVTTAISASNGLIAEQ